MLLQILFHLLHCQFGTDSQSSGDCSQIQKNKINT